MNEATRDRLLFAGWVGVGVSGCAVLLGAFTIGPLLLPVPLIALLALASRRDTEHGVPGLVSALGLPLLLLAYLNRGGPGTSCSTTASGQECTSGLLDPWPLLAGGLLLLAAGAVLFHLLQKRRRTRTAGRGRGPDQAQAQGPTWGTV